MILNVFRIRALLHNLLNVAAALGQEPLPCSIYLSDFQLGDTTALGILCIARPRRAVVHVHLCSLITLKQAREMVHAATLLRPTFHSISWKQRHVGWTKTGKGLQHESAFLAAFDNPNAVH